MQKRYFLLAALYLLANFSVQAQSYQTLLKGGHLIDAKNNINKVMDVAIQDGKIAAVAANIDPKMAKQVIDISGKYVTPGLIDIHGHVFAGTDPDGQLENGFSSLPADGFTFRVGVTTIVDCGDSGAETFELFKKNVIDKSQTRVSGIFEYFQKGNVW
jgi:dihydroorotase